MKTASEVTAFERCIQPILEILVPGHESELASLRPDRQMAARIEELAHKANEGELSAEERAEYQGYVRANKFVTVLRRQARRALDSRAGSDE